MSNAAALAQIKRSLIDNAGGYLRNTVHIPGETCAICRGTKMRDGCQTCYPCEFLYPNGADLIGSMVYGVDGLQSGKLMYGYKASPQIPVLVQRVSSLVALALREHIECAGKLVGAQCTHWATVPSLRNLESMHPFRTILTGMIKTDAEIEVAASPLVKGKTAQERRSHNPAFYDLRTPVPQGAHVLVLDDTWTSGAHGQSVATALRLAGAVKVSLLVVARWLDWDDRTKRIYPKHISPRPFNPDTCPWTGGECSR